MFMTLPQGIECCWDVCKLQCPISFSKVVILFSIKTPTSREAVLLIIYKPTLYCPHAQLEGRSRVIEYLHGRYLYDKDHKSWIGVTLENVLRQEKTKKISRVSLVHRRSVFELRRRRRASK